jgi:1-acylglycerone phosphate reductase
VQPFGISVIEVVTGFVRSNILHHGLYAPDDSLYLPIKAIIERIKYDGNTNGMVADAYARSIVSKLMQGYMGPEIWEGKFAWHLRFVIACCPTSLMVRKKDPHRTGFFISLDFSQNWIFFRYFQLYHLYGSHRVTH